MSRCERQQSSANSTRSWFDLLTMTLRPSKGQRAGSLGNLGETYGLSSPAIG